MAPQRSIDLAALKEHLNITNSLIISNSQILVHDMNGKILPVTIGAPGERIDRSKTNSAMATMQYDDRRP
jgi:hypothetical protein